MQATLTRLYVYPIKSCAGFRTEAWTLTEHGLEYDREWMVVDDAGEFIIQRSCPRMALIKADIHLGSLRIRAPGMLRLDIDLAPGPEYAPESLRVHVWNDWVQAEDQGPLCAEWFSRFLGQPCRLVRCPPTERRTASLAWTEGVESTYHFADAFPVLLLSEASLDDLNHRLSTRMLPPVPMERFRPNLVIGGVPAYEEDFIKTLQVANASLTIVKPCSRCSVPNIDTETAEQGVEPGDTLQTYRRNEQMGGAICFGQNAIVSRGLRVQLRVGLVLDGELNF